MRYEVQQFLFSQPELHQFVRQYPTWYRKLSRDPNALDKLKQEGNQFYRRTFTDKVDRLQGNLQLAMMLMQMFQSGNTDNQGG